MAQQNAANPADTQASFGLEQTPCLGDPASWHDGRVISEGVGASFPLIADPSIDVGGEETEGEPGKILPDGPFNVTWSAEEHAQLIAAAIGHGETPVQSPAGVYLHRLQSQATDIDFNPLAARITRAGQRPQTYRGGLPTSLVFNLAQSGLLSGAASMRFPRFDSWGDMVIDTGTPTGKLWLRGWPQLPILDAATDAERRIWMQVSSAPSGGSMGVKFKIGDAATYDGTEVTIADDTWLENILDELDAEIGTPDIPVDAYVDDTSLFALNDEVYLQWGTESAIWSPVLPAKAVFNEISATILVDGSEFRTRELTWSILRPVEPDANIGGRFVDENVEFGVRQSFGQLNRRAFKDVSMLNKIMRNEPFAIRLDALSTLIGATGVRRQLSIIAMNCKRQDRTPSVAGQASFDEPVGFRCYPSADATYPSAVTVEIVNSQADLTA